MSVPSPAENSSSLPSYQIKVNGKPIASDLQVEVIEAWLFLNRIPKARIVLYDGTPAARDFPVSNLETFAPGGKVEIALGYEGKNTKIFAGVITKQCLEVSEQNASRLIVEMADSAIKMTLQRKTAAFAKITDATLIEKLIKANGLKASVARTKLKQESLVQYDASDWDMMVTRAQANGFVVSVSDGTVTVARPDTQQNATLRAEYGEAILDLSAELDATTQLQPSAIKSYGWDSKTLKLAAFGPGSVPVKEPGNISSDALARVFGLDSVGYQTSAPLDNEELKEWSSAELLRSRLAKIRGEVRFQGNALASPGKVIELAGVGKRFNGPVLVSGTHHSVRNNLWVTTVQFGLDAQSYAVEKQDIASPSAAGLLPPAGGLQVGLVKKLGKDEAGGFRILVTLPLVRNRDDQGLWARLATAYASNGTGLLFVPEVGDEVIVAFMNDDPRYPVILGSLYGKKHAPPYPFDEKNSKKAIVTCSKLEITFDEENKTIEIKTPGKHQITLDDKGKQIAVRDSNGNSLSMTKSGIELKSAGNLTITAKGKVAIEAQSNLALAAKGNASMDGMQIIHNAKGKFSAQGKAAAEVSSSGLLTLRGTLVKIN
ncbi:MAG TPA: type VI secretion system tip protein VgrG [Dongiaceae bacterium]|nr:type VI secretion system tip protein VgrG [Dongiaceae bacterium]